MIVISVTIAVVVGLEGGAVAPAVVLVPEEGLGVELAVGLLPRGRSHDHCLLFIHGRFNMSGPLSFQIFRNRDPSEIWLIRFMELFKHRHETLQPIWPGLEQIYLLDISFTKYVVLFASLAYIFCSSLLYVLAFLPQSSPLLSILGLGAQPPFSPLPPYSRQQAAEKKGYCAQEERMLDRSGEFSFRTFPRPSLMCWLEKVGDRASKDKYFLLRPKIESRSGTRTVGKADRDTQVRGGRDINRRL